MTSSLPKSVRITDVGPRDGLQNEKAVVAIDDKIRFIETLARSGVAEVETTSFVSPKWVPQLADAADVFAQIERQDNVVYSALVPNEKGYRRALECGVKKVAVFVAASETFSQRNTNGTIDEVLSRFKPVIDDARQNDIVVRAYVSCVVACPFEGRVCGSQVRTVVSQLLDLGAHEIDLGETIGVAAPNDIEQLYESLDGVLEPEASTLHLHDTRGTALTCAYRALQLGVRSFDASCGGLGGCPYAPGAAGNLATEDLVYLCDQLGIETGVSLSTLVEASAGIAAALGRSLPGRVCNAPLLDDNVSCATGDDARS